MVVGKWNTAHGEKPVYRKHIQVSVPIGQKSSEMIIDHNIGYIVSVKGDTVRSDNICFAFPYTGPLPIATQHSDQVALNEYIDLYVSRSHDLVLRFYHTMKEGSLYSYMIDIIYDYIKPF